MSIPHGSLIDFACAVSRLEGGVPWKPYPYLRYIESRILAALRNPRGGRLIINIPPRLGKSFLVSKYLPLWYLECAPERSVMVTSYGDTLAQEWGRKVRDLLALPQLDTTVRRDVSATTRWETDLGGGMVTSGVGGPILGKGFHCFPGDVDIITEFGKMRIQDVCQLKALPKVLSFCHEKNTTEWKRVTACAVQPGKPLVEITLVNGRRLRCTADHPVFCSGLGYRMAGDIEAGQEVAEVEEAHALRDVRDRDNESRSVRPLLPRGEEDHLYGKVCRMWGRVQKVTRRSSKALEEWAIGSLLLSGLFHVSPRCEEQEDVQVREANRNENIQAVHGVQNCIEGSSPATQGDTLRVLREEVQANITQDGLLLKGLCERRPLNTNERSGKQPLLPREQLRGVVQEDETAHQKSRWKRLLNLWCGKQLQEDQDTKICDGVSDAEQVGSSSCRQEPEKQHPVKPDNPLLFVPHDAPQDNGRWGFVAVSSVEKTGETPNRVYDLQVEGSHNFFANGVLVHNCGIVDDPLKSWDEAQSPVYRRKVNDWFDGTFMSRAEPGATVVIIQQRLHERDLAGHLLAEYPEEWDLVALPGLAEKNDPMGRQEGEPLCPDRFDLEAMERIRDNKSPALWDAMYQQHPRPPGGTIIHEEWLKYYEQAPAKFDRVILSWDMTFKKTTAGSFVVGQAWGKLGADCYLLGQTRRRMDFDQSREAFVLQCEAYPEAAAKIIEDKANGPAIVSSLEGKVPGLIEWPVRGSKESRAHAVAPFFRAGNVLLPKGGKWMREYVAELTAFPGSEHDDQVHATTQALDYLMLGDAPATITGYKPAQQSPMRSARRHM